MKKIVDEKIKITDSVIIDKETIWKICECLSADNNQEEELEKSEINISETPIFNLTIDTISRTLVDFIREKKSEFDSTKDFDSYDVKRLIKSAICPCVKKLFLRFCDSLCSRTGFLGYVSFYLFHDVFSVNVDADTDSDGNQVLCFYICKHNMEIKD